MEHPPIVLTGDSLEAVEELKYLRAERAEIEKREKILRSEILRQLGDAPQAVDENGVTVVLVTKTLRTGVDRKMLEALYPQVFEDVMTETTAITVNLP